MFLFITLYLASQSEAQAVERRLFEIREQLTLNCFKKILRKT